MTQKTDAAKGAYRKLLATAIALPLVAGPSSYIWAAEGLQAQLTVSQRLEYSDDDNANDDGLIARTGLGLSLSSETRTQKLSFTADTGLTYNVTNSDASDRLDVDNPRLGLVYSVENRSSLLSFDARYRRIDIDDTAFLTDPDDPFSDLVTGDGTREIYSLGTSLVLGRDAPVSLSFDHRYGETSYSGTTDPDLVDITRQDIDARLTFRLSPVATAYVFASYLEKDAAGVGSSDRTEEKFGVGGSYDISPALRATAQLSYETLETDNNAGTVTDTKGLGYQLGFTLDRPNGILTANFLEEETVNGKRREVSFGRTYEIKRGDIALSVGVSKTDGLSAEPLINITANYELDALSTLGLSLSQSSTVDDDNDTTINTRLGLTYARELTELSRLTASIEVADRNVQTDTGEDQTSIRLNLSHRYQLGQDWDLVSGYSYSTTKRDALDDRNSSTLFVGLEKTFDFRP